MLYPDMHIPEGIPQVSCALNIERAGAKCFIADCDSVFGKIRQVVIAERQQRIRIAKLKYLAAVLPC